MGELDSKQNSYAIQKTRLRRALAGAFYYEAILIEYAMLEDRSESAIRHAGMKTVNQRGNPLMLSEKLNRINDHPLFQSSFIKKRLTRELIESIREWKRRRDELTHALLKRQPHDEAKDLAYEGAELVRLFDNKVRSVNDWRERKNEK